MILTNTITITVQFFALGRELIGTNALTLTLPEGASIENALEHIAASHPALASLPSFVTAVNTRYAGREHILQNNDVLAIIPPVSGG